MKFQRIPAANRKRSEKDIQEMQDMCGYFSPLNSWLRSQIESASDVVYAMEENILYGYIILDKKPKHLEIELICVGQEGQKRKGIGKSLMQEAEEIAKDYGLFKIELDSQFAAEGFYKKLNFNEISRNNHGVRMKKTLN
jgi:ribosomal protein S18 acetylase RimI-like enzyme